MKKFLIQIFIFSIFGYLVGEGVVRIFKLSVDAPDVYQDDNGLIRSYPNQTGYYVNGNKWIVTKYGEFGYVPPSLDSLITVIGDSYIANMMNPPECHQAAFLASMVKGYNFYPSAREGASFIEMMERAKSLNHLQPIAQLLFVYPGDFAESVKGEKKLPHTVQLSLETGKVKFPKLYQSKAKRLFQKSKFPYYLFKNYIGVWYHNTKNELTNNPVDIEAEPMDVSSKIGGLLDYVDLNFDTKNIILVFKPDTDAGLIELVKKHNYKTLLLKADDYKSWEMPTDHHWSCYGHEEAAKQVAKFINESSF